MMLLTAETIELILDYKVSIITFITYWGLYLASDVVFARLFPFYNKLSSGDRAEWGSRVVSTINALVTTYGCVVVLSTDRAVHEDPMFGYSMRAEWYHKVIIGYFVYDGLLVLANKQLRSFGTVVHHVLGLLGPGSATYYRHGQLFTLLWIFTEVTTPLVNNRWFLAVAKKTDSKFYIINGIAMTLAFIVFRCLLVPIYGAYALYTHWDNYFKVAVAIQYLLFICMVGVTSLNYYWTGLMIRGLLRHLGKKQTVAKKTK